MGDKLHTKIDRLLHDAENADSGASFALMMAESDPSNPTHKRMHRELSAKRDQLLGKALALDPDRSAPAWSETTLPTEVRAVYD
jgi:hypothetical protein